MDRVALILHGDANQPTLAEYYRKKTDCKLKHVKMDTSSCKSLDADGYCYPVATWEGKGHESHYCVVKSAQGYLIDWRCSIGYDPVPLVTFTAQYPFSAPSVFRVRAQLSDVFRADFVRSQRTHYSLTLRDRDGKLVQGYVERNSADGKKIFDELKDGREHPLLVELGYTKAAADAESIEVRRLVGVGHQERPEELVPPPTAVPPNLPPPTAPPSPKSPSPHP
jgi:hypothetical protein